MYINCRQKVNRLAEQLNEVRAAHVTSEQKMEEKVTKLADQLGVNVGHETTVAKVVKEETDKVEWVGVGMGGINTAYLS